MFRFSTLIQFNIGPCINRIPYSGMEVLQGFSSHYDSPLEQGGTSRFTVVSVTQMCIGVSPRLYPLLCLRNISYSFSPMAFKFSLW